MKNLIGVYYGFLADSDDVNWINCLERTKAAGLDLLEVSASKLKTLSKTELRKIADCAKDLEITLTSATGYPVSADLTSDDPEIRRCGVEFLREQLELLNSMNGKLLGGMLVGVGKNFPAGIEYERERRMQNALKPLREVAHIAADCGILLGMEAVNRFEAAMVNTAQEARAVVDAVAEPNLGILLDSFHMNIEEQSMEEAIRIAGDRLVHFHACENNRMVPGRAHVKWDEVFSGLREVKFKGALVMEVLAKPYGSVAGRLNIWRKLSEDADAELAEAGRFLRGMGETYGI